LAIDHSLCVCNTSYVIETTTSATNTNTMNIKTTERQSLHNPEKYIITHSVHFPESGANTVHQSGRALSKWSKGLTVNIHQLRGHYPHSFEFYTDNQREYAEGMLGFAGKELEDYDGVFCLPDEVMDVLDHLGFDTSSVRESQRD